MNKKWKFKYVFTYIYGLIYTEYAQLVNSFDLMSV